jgi:hypothetical protein
MQDHLHVDKHSHNSHTWSQCSLCNQCRACAKHNRLSHTQQATGLKASSRQCCFLQRNSRGAAPLSCNCN